MRSHFSETLWALRRHYGWRWIGSTVVEPRLFWTMCARRNFHLQDLHVICACACWIFTCSGIAASGSAKMDPPPALQSMVPCVILPEREIRLCFTHEQETLSETAPDLQMIRRVCFGVLSLCFELWASVWRSKKLRTMSLCLTSEEALNLSLCLTTEDEEALKLELVVTTSVVKLETGVQRLWILKVIQEGVRNLEVNGHVCHVYHSLHLDYNF